MRAATIDEIKATAVRLMHEHGSGVGFADIAREMGLSAPALYRYFADRNDLLSALMVDGFHELAAQIAAALDTAPADDLAARIEAAASAYRRFATADPQRFSLLFGLPAPGDAAHAKSTAEHANVSAMTQFEQLVRSVIDHGVLPSPLVQEVGPAFASEVPNKQAAEGARIPADAYQALLHTLTAIHGFACLETFGHLEWLNEQARDELFQAQITLLAHAMGDPIGHRSSPVRARPFHGASA
jgi:AcrR family transcriptional regulator